MVEYTPKKEKNGGRTITVSGKDGAVTLNVISGYAPTWSREQKTTNGSSNSFITWDGREIKSDKTTVYMRFSLSVSTYGMTPSEADALRTVIAGSGELTLSCHEFSGMVTAEEFSTRVTNSNRYGDFSASQIKFTAVEAALVQAPDSYL